jgi:hypothetical protein
MDRPQYSAADAVALRACQNGDASPDQQQRAIAYIVNVVCQTYDQCWRKEQSMTDLALGQALPGQHIVWLLKEAKVSTNDNPEQ